MRVLSLALSSALLLLAILSPSLAADTPQEHMLRLHQEVQTLGDQAFEAGSYNEIDGEHSLLAIQREGHTLKEASQRANIAYIQQHGGSSDITLEVVQIEGDLLDVQIDSVWNYMDTKQTSFKSTYDAANQQEAALEQLNS